MGPESPRRNEIKESPSYGSTGFLHSFFPLSGKRSRNHEPVSCGAKVRGQEGAIVLGNQRIATDVHFGWPHILVTEVH
jgi:hypothetical protein